MQPNPNDPYGRDLSTPSPQDSLLSGKGRVGLLLGVLGTGFLLYQLGGGFPPPAWMLVWRAFQQAGPTPAHFPQLLIQSFILLVAWLLLLLVALQVVRPGRTRRGGEETPGAAPLLPPRAPSPLAAQQAWATPIAPKRNTDNAEERYQHPWKDSSASWKTPTSAPSWSSAASTREESQEEARFWTQQPQEYSRKPFPQRTEREAPYAAASSLVLHPFDSEMQEQRVSGSNSAVTARYMQPQPPPPLVKEIHQDTSRGDASTHSFQIDLTHLGETDLDGVGVLGWSLCHPGIQRTQAPLEDFLLVVGGLRTQVTPQVPFALFILADGNISATQDSSAEIEGSLSRACARWFGDAIISVLCGPDPLEPQAVLRVLTEGMQQVNKRLHHYNLREQTSEIVTMTAILILGTEAYTANVGDNRAYFYRLKRSRQATDEGLFQITNDHSSIATQLEQGVLTPDDLFKQPKSEQVYRALGQQATLNTVDVFSITLSAGDVLALCSDGLWKVVREATLLHIVERLLQPPVSSPALLCPALVQAALEAGGHDHTSIMVVQVQPSDEAALHTEREPLT